ncbi:hypothetical protein [Sorangium sp. So ce861]|uniref:hypothetical protein n=1 Tax=Sorangium sp. So ce861 TaxID=3133323 RepID=UPI003F604A83
MSAILTLAPDEQSTNAFYGDSGERLPKNRPPRDPEGSGERIHPLLERGESDLHAGAPAGLTHLLELAAQGTGPRT